MYQLSGLMKRTAFMKTQFEYLLQVKVNLDHNSLQMHRVISMNKKLIQNVVSGEKYGTK